MSNAYTLTELNGKELTFCAACALRATQAGFRQAGWPEPQTMEEAIMLMQLANFVSATDPFLREDNSPGVCVSCGKSF